MKNCIKLLAFAMFSFAILTFGNNEDENESLSLNYQTGRIELASGNAFINIPEGFKYLGQKEAFFVLTTLWNNPPDSSILGLLVPEEKDVLNPDAWVFTLKFDEMGYVEDEDAEKIDYDDLLKEQRKDFEENNKERISLGYEPIEFVGWASTPYYDKANKILHWAKELKFGTDSINTLNYNLRVLGRKGIFVMNAVASINQLEEVKPNIDIVLASIEFKEGHRYADFMPSIDKVAAYSVGGLVAGKILAKAGFFVVLAKFWKLILFGIIGVGAAIMRFFKKSVSGE